MSAVTKPAFAHDDGAHHVHLAQKHLSGLSAERRAALENEWSPPAAKLEEELAVLFGHRAAALAQAYYRFCGHKDRARFEAEVRAIQSCNMIGGMA